MVVKTEKQVKNVTTHRSFSEWNWILAYNHLYII